MKKKILVLALVIMVLVTFVYGCDKEAPPEDVGDINYGNYDKLFDDVDFQVIAINEEIAQGTDKVAAFEHILEVAETNSKNATCYAKVSQGGGEAYTGGVGGSMNARSRYIKNDGGFYYEIAGHIYASEPAAALPFAQDMLDQGRREYSRDMTTFYQQEPGGKGSPTMKTEFPYYTMSYPTDTEIESFDVEGWKEERNIREIGEFTSFVFAEDTVKDIEVTYDEENEMYTLSFALNLEDETARNKATEFPRASLRKIAKSDDIEYSVYKYTMKIWENGLIRSISTEESWSGTISVWILTLEGSSTSTNIDYYSWDPEDCSLDDIDLSWVPSQS